MNKIAVPPIKCQGIKTKLVPWVKNTIPRNFSGNWIEPFMGSGVVAFNVRPKTALLCDTNPHLIDFYNAIKTGKITADSVRDFLKTEGNLLKQKGQDHYYEIRQRFNQKHDPIDFLFLNRACFNGMIRFNSKGGFNVPFCRKPERFAPAYITKIVNQVSYVQNLLRESDYTFICQGFEQTIREGKKDDIIYCDPPYLGRHVDYYNGWDEMQEQTLNRHLSNAQSKFILSTWHSNDYRANEHLETLWKPFNLLTKAHFYHVGGYEKNRNPVLEALVTNFDPNYISRSSIPKVAQLAFL